MAASDLSLELTDEDCIRNRLTKLAECPVCYETMSTTEMCVNGHTVCRRCRGQLQVCPLCSKAFGNIRNLLGEEVAELLACRRCCNSQRGCNKFLSINDCKKHEEGCDFRLYSCKECEDELCFMELKGHFLGKHENSFIQPYITRELQHADVQEGKQYFNLIEFNSDLFWFWRKYNNAQMYFGLLYCGDSEKISAYKYNLQLVSKSEKSDMEFTGPVLADAQESFRYAQDQDFVVLSKNFMGEGAKFQVSIAKA